MGCVINIGQHTIFAFSDTHGDHRDLCIPKGVDIVICAGDVVEDNLKGDEYDGFIDWFASQPAEWKIFVPGNHELSFDIGQAEAIVTQMSDRNILVLEDAVIECDDIVIASISANSKIADADIPNDIDILVTHYPPYGILDEDMGSTEILNFVLKSRPQWHLFGHIHSTAGQSAMLGCTECRNIG